MDLSISSSHTVNQVGVWSSRIINPSSDALIPHHILTSHTRYLEWPLHSHEHLKVSLWLNLIRVAKQQQPHLGRPTEFFFTFNAVSDQGHWGLFSEPHFLLFIRFLPVSWWEAAIWVVSIMFSAVSSAQLAFKRHVRRPWPTPGSSLLCECGLSWLNVGQQEEDGAGGKRFCFDRCGKTLYSSVFDLSSHCPSGTDGNNTTYCMVIQLQFHQPGLSRPDIHREAQQLSQSHHLTSWRSHLYI